MQLSLLVCSIGKRHSICGRQRAWRVTEIRHRDAEWLHDGSACRSAFHFVTARMSITVAIIWWPPAIVGGRSDGPGATGAGRPGGADLTPNCLSCVTQTVGRRYHCLSGGFRHTQNYGRAVISSNEYGPAGPSTERGTEAKVREPLG
jgi:hypothetical protein